MNMKHLEQEKWHPTVLPLRPLLIALSQQDSASAWHFPTKHSELSQVFSQRVFQAFLDYRTFFAN